MKISDLTGKNVLICCSNLKIREDTKFVFDNVGCYTDCDEISRVEDFNIYDYVFCFEDWNGIDHEKILDLNDVCLILDDELQSYNIAGKKIAIYGISKKTDIVINAIQGKYILVANDGDGVSEYKGEKVYKSSEIDVKDYFYIIAGDEFDKDIFELESMGLKVNEDFIDGDIFSMPKYSEMLKKTLFDKPQNQVGCALPFYNFIIDGRMNPYPCCPAGVLSKWVCKERLYFKTCKELWDSTWMKIYRLSMVNKTYSFCDPHFCNRLHLNAGETDKRDHFELFESPTDMQLEFDYTCNLHCPSCRKGVAVATPYRKYVLDKIVSDFKQNQIMDNLEWTRLAGYGDVFASEYYQELLYSDKKRKNLFLITNANLLTEEKFDRLIPCYENIDIYISIDAATEETYNQMRPGGNWNKLLENLRMISKKKREGLVRFFRIQMVVQKDNYKEIPDFVKMGIDLDVSDVYMNNIRKWGHISDEEYSKKNILDHNNQVIPEVQSYIDIAKTLVTDNPKFLQIDFCK